MWVLRAWEPGMWYRLPQGYFPFVRIGGIGRALVWIRCERVQREACVMVLARVPSGGAVGQVRLICGRPWMRYSARMRRNRDE
jgi:hypothetical protein